MGYVRDLKSMTDWGGGRTTAIVLPACCSHNVGVKQGIARPKVKVPGVPRGLGVWLHMTSALVF